MASAENPMSVSVMGEIILDQKGWVQRHSAYTPHQTSISVYLILWRSLTLRVLQLKSTLS